MLTGIQQDDDAPPLPCFAREMGIGAEVAVPVGSGCEGCRLGGGAAKGEDRC